MSLFSIIPDGQAITLTRGVHRQVPVYERGGRMYAQHGGGFVRLLQGGATSTPNTRWIEIVDAAYAEYEGSVHCVAENEG